MQRWSLVFGFVASRVGCIRGVVIIECASNQWSPSSPPTILPRPILLLRNPTAKSNARRTATVRYRLWSYSGVVAVAVFEYRRRSGLRGGMVLGQNCGVVDCGRGRIPREQVGRREEGRKERINKIRTREGGRGRGEVGGGDKRQTDRQTDYLVVVGMEKRDEATME
ncbi:uncharacterized protein LY79DRAFT_163229 [Colletotrichum navitas]|uniref:Uncharacterized protein n=1 Tax=Colletotrichum navitas TaxID=681940 RepID=A0AAD8V4S9_9PEZI|nr:uncharacterized protein LY79DRAFT_163229 [Colletotrichum navitas]KAK1594257.1 hypothetical protein LY79DRAFT_163229 [Colletotrichum navitas]